MGTARGDLLLLQLVEVLHSGDRLAGLIRAVERLRSVHRLLEGAPALGLHTSWGGGHLRHPDFPRTVGKSSKSTIFH